MMGSPRQTTTHARSPSRVITGGFTLMELLVVISIIVLLIALLLPALAYARKKAAIQATAAELGSMRIALAQYYSDFSVFPDSSSVNTYGAPKLPSGASRFAEAMVGYLGQSYDGCGPINTPTRPGPPYGFRMSGPGSVLGRVYGPYIKITTDNFAQDTQTPNPNDEFFVDLFGQQSPILYYRSNLPAGTIAPVGVQIFGNSPNNAGGYIFNAYDNAAAFLPNQAPGNNTLGSSPSGNQDPSNGDSVEFYKALGEAGGTNKVQAGEQIIGEHSYLLVSAGPDGIFYDTTLPPDPIHFDVSNDDVISQTP